MVLDPEAFIAATIAFIACADERVATGPELCSYPLSVRVGSGVSKEAGSIEDQVLERGIPETA